MPFTSDFYERHWAAVNKKYDILAEHSRADLLRAQTDAQSLPGYREALGFHARAAGQQALEGAATEVARRYMDPEWIRATGRKMVEEGVMPPFAQPGTPGAGAPDAGAPGAGAPGAGAPPQIQFQTLPEQPGRPAASPTTADTSQPSNILTSPESIENMTPEELAEWARNAATPQGVQRPTAQRRPAAAQTQLPSLLRPVPVTTSKVPAMSPLYSTDFRTGFRRGIANVEPRGYKKGDEDISDPLRDFVNPTPVNVAPGVLAAPAPSRTSVPSRASVSLGPLSPGPGPESASGPGPALGLALGPTPGPAPAPYDANQPVLRIPTPNFGPYDANQPVLRIPTPSFGPAPAPAPAASPPSSSVESTSEKYRKGTANVKSKGSKNSKNGKASKPGDSPKGLEALLPLLAAMQGGGGAAGPAGPAAGPPPAPGMKKGSANVKGKGGKSKSGDQPAGLEALLSALGAGGAPPAAGAPMPMPMAPGAAAPPGFAYGMSDVQMAPPTVPALMPMVVPRLMDTGYAAGTPSVQPMPNYPFGAGYLFGASAVPGEGTGKTDTVPAMLAPHEAVLNRAAADMLGRGLIAALNSQGVKQMGMRRGTAT